jgi:hypothetical protein
MQRTVGILFRSSKAIFGLENTVHTPHCFFQILISIRYLEEKLWPILQSEVRKIDLSRFPFNCGRSDVSVSFLYSVNVGTSKHLSLYPPVSSLCFRVVLSTVIHQVNDKFH